MPRLTDSLPLESKFLDRRIKLLPCQKEMVKWWYDNKGLGIRELAKMFHVSRRSIQFILFPERLKRNKELRADRGGSKVYYNKDKWREEMKEHRNWKKEVLSEVAKRPKL